MKKLMLIAALALTLGTGTICSGVLPEEFYGWLDSLAPPGMYQALYSAAGVPLSSRPAPAPAEGASLNAASSAAAASGLPGSDYAYIAERVAEGVKNKNKTIEIPLTLPGGSDDAVTEYFLEAAALAIDGIRREIPEVFWISLGPYNIEWNGVRSSGDGVLAIHMNYCYSSGEIAALQKQIDDVVDGVLASAPGNPADAAGFFHDWIVEHTAYATDAAESGTISSEYSVNIDGVFLRGSAVCEGYSKAFKLLCDRAGIECEIVFGVANGENHSWNYVRLDDNWYLADCTWDAPVSNEKIMLRDYFLKGAQSKVDGKRISEIYIDDGAGYPALSALGYFER